VIWFDIDILEFFLILGNFYQNLANKYLVTLAFWELGFESFNGPFKSTRSTALLLISNEDSFIFKSDFQIIVFYLVTSNPDDVGQSWTTSQHRQRHVLAGQDRRRIRGL